ncbi:Na+/H+ antiporter NhaA [Novosphingobium piscinae]|uniref:Na(+)/H(+) antiporter NhaA n=1 Tax=Novosphingobium piscinae TaxID=1507448 RepID=A0A7X1G0L7_9SPHN|nr:Na+/H+ antiporter NhaA [Novosphingobium piscinae]MBC2670431.1 Na+/H+ antiporter NhaA [Novosphingobium piscinae]
MTPRRHAFTRLATRLNALAHGEAGAALLLMAAAGAAIALANSPGQEGYHRLIHGPLAWTPLSHLGSLELWINDGLMALFFFVVGLEIKREVLDGELASPSRRRLPVLAALAGMACPALVYLALAHGLSGPAGASLSSGWAIPAATDIAFAVGVLALVGRGLPPSLRLFLLTVAIVDDLGAVLIIALAYTPAVATGWLALAAVLWLAMAGLGRRRFPHWAAYAVLGLGLWFAVLHSGIHATIAGVLAAFTIPLQPSQENGDSLLLRLEHGLAPWNAYVIVPLFGFANAGVGLGGGLGEALEPLPLAVAGGLFLGKQIGVFGAIILAERTGFAPRPAGATLRQLWGLAALCGIGFTMSLFIANLAFPGAPEQIEAAKLGIVAGSLLAALLGYALLRSARAPT